MSADSVTGPIEIVILEFPGSRFNGEIAPALAQLTDDDVIRILDLVIVTKDADGTVIAVELSDLDGDDASAINDLDGEIDGLLSDEDLQIAGAALALGTTALVIVWEAVWARKVAAAVAGSGGRLVAHDRLDTETVQTLLAESRS